MKNETQSAYNQCTGMIQKKMKRMGDANATLTSTSRTYEAPVSAHRISFSPLQPNPGTLNHSIDKEIHQRKKETTKKTHISLQPSAQLLLPHIKPLHPAQTAPDQKLDPSLRPPHHPRFRLAQADHKLQRRLPHLLRFEILFVLRVVFRAGGVRVGREMGGRWWECECVGGGARGRGGREGTGYGGCGAWVGAGEKG